MNEWTDFRNSSYFCSFFFLLFFLRAFDMVRFKHRWILFQVIQDPIIENGQVVYPKTSLRLTDQMISRAIYNQVEIYYGQYGKGLGSIAGKHL